MKNLKKNLLTLACALLLVVATVFTTLAYLVDSNNIVTNTFTVGKVDIDIGETPVDPETGDPILDPEDPWVEENEYPLVPGDTYTKNPTILVKPGSQESWIFVEVLNGLEGVISTDSLTAQMEDNDWVHLEGNIYYYKDTVAGAPKGDNAKDVELRVFDTITIDSKCDAEALENVDGSKIIVNGYAIQVSENFADAGEAWAALTAQLDA